MSIEQNTNQWPIGFRVLHADMGFSQGRVALSEITLNLVIEWLECLS